MAHEWEDVSQGIEGLSNYGKRRCKRCGVEQTKEAEQVWMRIVGYKWFPLAGRCKGTMVDKHGGKREGAGRKPDPESRSIPRSIRVSRLVDQYLTEHGTGQCEESIRRSKAFRDWVKSRASR